MLFKTRFHAGLRDGSIDLTFRRWTKPQVKVGGKYRFGGGDDVLVVHTIDKVPVGKITTRDARRAGFPDTTDLGKALSSGVGPHMTARTVVYRIAFHHEIDMRSAPKPTLAGHVDDCIARLERMDTLSRGGPWTRKVLVLIASNPRVAASKLAPRLGRETRPFKVDVRKLKKLGLTRSHEVGYELTPLGRRVVDCFR